MNSTAGRGRELHRHGAAAERHRIAEKTRRGRMLLNCLTVGEEPTLKTNPICYVKELLQSRGFCFQYLRQPAARGENL
jgi:hypothetical protein